MCLRVALEAAWGLEARSPERPKRRRAHSAGSIRWRRPEGLDAGEVEQAAFVSVAGDANVAGGNGAAHGPKDEKSVCPRRTESDAPRRDAILTGQCQAGRESSGAEPLGAHDQPVLIRAFRRGDGRGMA